MNSLNANWFILVKQLRISSVSVTIRVTLVRLCTEKEVQLEEQ